MKIGHPKEFLKLMFEVQPFTRVTKVFSADNEGEDLNI